MKSATAIAFPPVDAAREKVTGSITISISKYRKVRGFLDLFDWNWEYVMRIDDWDDATSRLLSNDCQAQDADAVAAFIENFRNSARMRNASFTVLNYTGEDYKNFEFRR